QSLGSGAARGEQGDIQSAVGGGLGVLDLDVLAVPREVATRRARRREVPDARDRKTALGQHGAHDSADLSGRADDSDVHDRQATGAWSSSNAACRALTALSTSRARTTQLMRIDDVLIISMFTPSSARISNMRAA